MVRGALFDQDGNRILTWSADKTARLWDARTGQMGPVLQHDDLVGCALFSNKNKNRILTWSNDKTVRLWDVYVDDDFPADEVKIWFQAVTGAELDKDTHEVQILKPEEWNKMRNDYELIAKKHAEHFK